MAAPSAPQLIDQAVARVQAEVPAFASLKLVVGLELRGRGDVQLYRVELPGPSVSKGPAADAKVRLSISRSHFNELASDGHVGDWRSAFEQGHARATGPAQILRLIANVAARNESRARTSKQRR